MNLLKTLGAVSGLTLISRLTGLLRETLIARSFGAGEATDAFFIAFRIPNLLRRLFAEGAFSQAFVPLLGRIKAQDGETAAVKLIDATAVLLTASLLIVSVLGVIAAPILVYVLAAGQSAGTYEQTVFLTRVMFPYIAFMSLTAMAAGVLNTWRQFAVPAFTPVLLNVSMIAACLWLAPYTNPPILALALGVMVGGVLQLGLQLPALAKLGLLPKFSFTVKAAAADAGVKNILKAMLPALIGVSVGQLSLIINTQIASHLGSGAVSWLSFADRLMELPIALLGVALSTVLLPSLSKAANDQNDFSNLLDWGLRLVVLLALPAALALAALALPLTAALYHYGAFSQTALINTAQSVAMYSVAVLGFCVVKVLAPAFYAQNNVKTPVKIALGVLLVTQLINIATVPLLGVAGLALSIGVASLFNAGLLFYGLYKRGLYAPQAGWLRFTLKVSCACALMTAGLHFAASPFDWAALQAAPWQRLGLLLAICAAGATVYFATLLLLGVKLRSFLRRV